MFLPMLNYFYIFGTSDVITEWSCSTCTLYGYDFNQVPSKIHHNTENVH